jgi:hypothetical protein
MSNPNRMLAVGVANAAVKLPPEREQFAPWDDPAVRTSAR